SLPATSPVVVPFLSFPWFRSRRALHPFPTRRSSDLSLPIRQFGSFHPGNGIGGAGVHWAAQTWRFYPSDMSYRSHHVARYGQDMIPEGCTVQDWPLTYEELEPYYTRMEYDIGVSGRSGNLGGRLQPG